MTINLKDIASPEWSNFHYLGFLNNKSKQNIKNKIKAITLDNTGTPDNVIIKLNVDFDVSDENIIYHDEEKKWLFLFDNDNTYYVPIKQIRNKRLYINNKNGKPIRVQAQFFLDQFGYVSQEQFYYYNTLGAKDQDSKSKDIFSFWDYETQEFRDLNNKQYEITERKIFLVYEQSLLIDEDKQSTWRENPNVFFEPLFKFKVNEKENIYKL